MAFAVKRSRWLSIFPFALTVKQSNGQCYLENTVAKCAVCWAERPGNASACGWRVPEACKEDTVKIVWDVELPDAMDANEDYAVRYTVKLDLREYPVVAKAYNGEDGEYWHVPHSNIHSCPAGGNNTQTCTPFVKNDGTLSTHTAATVKNLTFSPEAEHLAFATFDAIVNLPAATYTIIVHIRVYTPDTEVDSNDSCWPDCEDVKHDIAIGVLRKVEDVAAATSCDAYIATGVVFALILMSVVVVGWTARTGRLDLDAILQALSCEEVVLANELLLESGDIVAFTVSVFQEVLPAKEFVQLVPAFVATLILGWLVSIVEIVNMIVMSCELFRQRWQPEAMKKARCNSAMDLDPGLSRSAVSEETIQELFLERERSRRTVVGQYNGILSVVLKDCPMCALGALMLAKGGGDVDVVVLVAFFLSSAVLGSKLRALSAFTVDKHAFKQACETLGKALKSEVIRTSWRQSRGISTSSSRSHGPGGSSIAASGRSGSGSGIASIFGRGSLGVLSSRNGSSRPASVNEEVDDEAHAPRTVRMMSSGTKPLPPEEAPPIVAMVSTASSAAEASAEETRGMVGMASSAAKSPPEESHGAVKLASPAAKSPPEDVLEGSLVFDDV